jgi:hypothetical protein
MTYRNIETGIKYELLYRDVVGIGEKCRGCCYAFYIREGIIYTREQNDFNKKFEKVL